MSSYPILPDLTPSGDFLVPGTCFATPIAFVPPAETQDRAAQRDVAARRRYLRAALSQIPRLLGAIDRNPYRPTYGCLDRQFWHYRTAAFPSEMYQEGVLPLALAYAVNLPENCWYRNPRVRELVIAGIRFAARSCHADGSCDDYYPFERALGAAVFSLQAAARAYQLLKLDDPDLTGWFRRRAAWVIEHDEPGRLANHHALAALGLLRLSQITGEQYYRDAARARIDQVLAWQDEEGWFEEYGGADPGYQTVTIDCLAKYWKATGEDRLLGPLQRAVDFARLFLHPDHSYGGQYGSRGTYHFYPHGMELLACQHAHAAELADGFLASLTAGTVAYFDDDRMFAHRLGNLIEAYLDWSPTCPPSRMDDGSDTYRYFPHARILVRRTPSMHTVISAARGGVFKHFTSPGPGAADAGFILETVDGRLAVSQYHDLGRRVEVSTGENGATPRHLSVAGPLHWTRFETATPLKQSLLLTGMWTGGRFCRTAVRGFLQKRVITGRKESPIRFTRSFEFLPQGNGHGDRQLRVTDLIELTEPNVQIRRMAFGTDHETAYVAASGVYQESVLAPWTDLSKYVGQLNSQRRVVITREL